MRVVTISVNDENGQTKERKKERRDKKAHAHGRRRFLRADGTSPRGDSTTTF